MNALVERFADAVCRDRSGFRRVARLAHATRTLLERERGFLLIDGFAEYVRMQRTGHGATVRFVVLIP